VRTELQNAADAAALAGADALEPYFVQYNLPGQTNPSQVIANAQAAARTAAKKISAANTAGNVNVVLQDSDITFGYMDANGNYTSPTDNFPNCVAVIARRDDTQNGSVKYFFGSVIGTSSAPLQAPARATIYAGDVVTMQDIGLNAHVLPIALDVNIWKTFYQTGYSPDGQQHAGPNGAWQIQVYPIPHSSPGNFSLVDIGPPANDSGAFRAWTDTGMAPSDIDYLLSTGQLPVSPSAPEMWKSGPGMTDTLVNNFGTVLNVPNLIPLFLPESTSPYQAAYNSGQNSTYNVIGFAAVIVSQCSGNGGNLTLSIQPAGLSDPSFVLPNPTPAGTTPSSVTNTSPTTFTAPKLTS
jgi:hypothetical protein